MDRLRKFFKFKRSPSKGEAAVEPRSRSPQSESPVRDDFKPKRSGLQFDKEAYMEIVIQHVKNRGNPADSQFTRALYFLIAGQQTKDNSRHEHGFKPVMQAGQRDRIINDLGRNGVFKYIRENKAQIDSAIDQFVQQHGTGSAFKVESSIFQQNLRAAQQQNFNRNKHPVRAANPERGSPELGRHSRDSRSPARLTQGQRTRRRDVDEILNDLQLSEINRTEGEYYISEPENTERITYSLFRVIKGRIDDRVPDASFRPLMEMQNKTERDKIILELVEAGLFDKKSYKGKEFDRKSEIIAVVNNIASEKHNGDRDKVLKEVQTFIKSLDGIEQRANELQGKRVSRDDGSVKEREFIAHRGRFAEGGGASKPSTPYM